MKGTFFRESASTIASTLWATSCQRYRKLFKTFENFLSRLRFPRLSSATTSWTESYSKLIWSSSVSPSSPSSSRPCTPASSTGPAVRDRSMPEITSKKSFTTLSPCTARWRGRLRRPTPRSSIGSCSGWSNRCARRSTDFSVALAGWTQTVAFRYDSITSFMINIEFGWVMLFYDRFGFNSVSFVNEWNF